ncbi:COMM domain-containing protein 6-like [Oopsacas minuta]|uniref:COMM domain-containing protein 6-like n=1 Tax=Oopsacas minuta TaxID=111878 RepID=A0AAV7JRF0_9METZ|nr:COMM domain-containing protein 6-like [Oopsacas minuta]
MPLKVLKDIPRGLVETGEAINAIPSGLLLEMCQDVIAWITHSATFLNTEYYQEMCFYYVEPVGQTISAVMDSIQFIFECGAKVKATSAHLVSDLKQVLLLSQDKLQVFQEVWESEGSTLIESLQTPTDLSIGKLVAFDWKLSVAISSSSCKNLTSARVDVRLKVSNPDGQVTTHSFSLSLPEFHNFAKQIRDMVHILETV